MNDFLQAVVLMATAGCLLFIVVLLTQRVMTGSVGGIGRTLKLTAWYLVVAVLLDTALLAAFREWRIGLPYFVFVQFGLMLVTLLCFVLLQERSPPHAAAVIVGGGATYVAAVVLMLFVLRPFKLTTNGSAPTLRGYHAIGVCNECGGELILRVANLDRMETDGPRFDDRGICSACWKHAHSIDNSHAPRDPDLMFVDRLREPARWDIVAYRFPNDPSQIHVARLVGLPYEKIMISDDGLLSIEGVTTLPPPPFEQLRYTARPHDVAREELPLRGDPQRPMVLSDDEFLVLGDNTHASLDGRFWGPLKRSAIVGTASMIYWPPNRWRIFE